MKGGSTQLAGIDRFEARRVGGNNTASAEERALGAGASEAEGGKSRSWWEGGLSHPGPVSEVTVHQQTKLRTWAVIFKANWNGLRKAPRKDSELPMLTCIFFSLLLFSDSFLT